jgi:hypothetical protein
MGCCGQSRAGYAASDEVRSLPAASPLPAVDRPAAAPPRAAAGGVRLRFSGAAAVRVRGPVSGADYAFSGSDPVRTVAASDAEGLLRTGYFRRAY